jgi:hypothetical protein
MGNHHLKRRSRRVRSQSGNTILMILAFIAVGSMLFYPMLSKIKEIYAQQNKTANVMQERLALNSLIDFVIYAFKQRMCLSQSLTPEASCDLTMAGSTEAMMLTTDSISFLQQAHAQNPSVVVPTMVDTMTLSGSFSNFTSASPLYYIRSSLSKTPITSYKITVSRIISASLPQSANQIYISINAQLSDSSGTFPLVLNGSTMSMTSLLSIYPREVGTFALMISRDLRMDEPFTSAPCQVSLSGGSYIANCTGDNANGDTIINQFSSSSTIVGAGLVFESPVFVNGDVHLPGGNHLTAGNYSPVTFADRLYVGNGKIYQGASAVYTPSQAGLQTDSQWNNNVLFGGFQKGVQFDGAQDAGLQVFSGATPAYTSATLTNLIAQCISLTNSTEDATLTENTLLAASFGTPPALGATSATYNLGFSQQDQFSDQVVANRSSDNTPTLSGSPGGNSGVTLSGFNLANQSAILNVNMFLTQGNGAVSITSPMGANSLGSGQEPGVSMSLGSTLTMTVDPTSYYDAQVKAMAKYIYSASIGPTANFNNIAQQVNSVAQQVSSSINVNSLPVPNTLPSGASGISSMNDQLNAISTQVSGLGSQISSLSSFLATISPAPLNLSDLQYSLTTASNSAGTLNAALQTRGSIGAAFSSFSTSATAAYTALSKSLPSVTLTLSPVTINNNVEPNQAQLTISINNSNYLFDMSSGTVDPVTQVKSGPTLVVPIVKMIAYDNSFAGGLPILPLSTSSTGLSPTSLQLPSVTKNCPGIQAVNPVAGMPSLSYGDCRIQNMSGELDLSYDGNGNIIFPALKNSVVANTSNQDSISGNTTTIPLLADVAGLGAQCGAASGAVTSAAFGSATWANTDFSPQTIHSWNYAAGSAALTTTQVQQSSYAPVVDVIAFDGNNADATKGNVSFQVYSVAHVCDVQKTANFVSGFLTCQQFIVEPRSTPLRIVGTVITNGAYIDPTALAAGITWSSIYQTQATSELQAAGVLAGRFPAANPPSCSQTQLTSPIWNPAPAAPDMANLYGCNVLSLRADSNPIQWTAVDPDCGVLDGTGTQPCTATSTSCQSNTTCKHHMINFFVIEQGRAGGP